MDSLRASRFNGSWLPQINAKQDLSFLPGHHKAAYDGRIEQV